MSKGPKGGRPPGRSGGAGTGPSGGSRSGGTGRGSSHKGGTSSGSSGKVGGVMLWIAAAPFIAMALAIAASLGYVVFGQ